MFSTPTSGGRLFVEPLEQRIAPTGLTALANHPQDAGADNYVTYNTPPAAGKLGFVPASSVGVAGPANLYALALSGDGTSTLGADGQPNSNGDRLLIFTPDGYRTFIQAADGKALAFFLDGNNDGQVQNDELTGIALSGKAIVNVNGNVNGDIVTNLAADGSLMLNSPGNFKQAISGLSVSGNVFGNIIAGGNVTNVVLNGSVTDIYAGTAANGKVYDFAGPGLTTGALTTPDQRAGKAGGSIINVNLGSVTDRLQAGDGATGGRGGSIVGLTVQADSDGFNLFSGNGGDGSATRNGGDGGAIDTVIIRGTADLTPNSLIAIQAGHGGANGALSAGAGGDITGVASGFDAFEPLSGARQQSASLLQDNLFLHAGAGGDGHHAGVGGSVTNSFLTGSITDDALTAADGTPNAELQIFGGAGGHVTVGGNGARGGKGGDIAQVDVENVNTTLAGTAASILLQAGDAGLADQDGKGRAGGGISGAALLGFHVTANAGAGADGDFKGGHGGNLDAVSVLNSVGILANEINLNAGVGGASQFGKGGAGGDVSVISVQDSDLTSLIINSGQHANGGVGGGGKGGNGGSLNNVVVGDSGPFRTNAAFASVRAGTGAAGLFSAGNGGNIDTLQLLGSDLAFNVAAGDGGSVIQDGRGRGGDGGSITNSGISNQLTLTTTATDTGVPLFSAGGTGTLTAGSGGSGQAQGGLGGGIAANNVLAVSDISLVAGQGGQGGRRSAGAGGSLSATAANSLLGAITAAAGDAGGAGRRPGAGGSVDTFTASAATAITLTAGNGASGGAGGSITNSGTSFNALTGLANDGNITVRAGNGSSIGGTGGAGGSITTFNGLVGLSGATTFNAGNGGGGAGDDASGAGGSISQVTLNGPGNDQAIVPVFVSLDAGDAGQAGLARKGAGGGGVDNVTILNLTTSTTLHHISAGDGASGAARGGAGGSISLVDVGVANDAAADIGVRSGRNYGYANDAAGGLFAGVGGSGSKRSSPSGDVTDITANAIASIAAGKGATPALAGNVDFIYLNGLTPLTVNGTGAFDNVATANFVGSILAPGSSGASFYQNGGGVVAAQTIGINRNFVPEAAMTIDPATGALVLADFQEPTRSVVITPV